MVVGCVAPLPAGCVDDDLADLEALVSRDGGPGGAVARVVPPPATPAPFAYRAVDERSPFEPAAAELDADLGRSALHPDFDRPRQALEQFPLGQLKFVGGMRGRGVAYALIREPTGEVRLVAAGDYVGADHGRVVRVRDDGLDLVEIVRDGGGGWLQRSRFLALVPVTEQPSEPVAEDGS